LATQSAKGRRGFGRRPGDERGVALVEFALVLPLVMLLLLGLVDFGKAFTMWIDETHLASAAARYAAVANHRGTPIASDADITAFEEAMEDDGDTKELRDSFDDPMKPANGIRICFPASTSGPPGTEGKKGQSIRIDVRATYRFLDFLGGIVPSMAVEKGLTAHSVQRIEKEYDPAVVATRLCPTP
jgi:Flp pilus assembly pilin Flp